MTSSDTEPDSLGRFLIPASSSPPYTVVVKRIGFEDLRIVATTDRAFVVRLRASTCPDRHRLLVDAYGRQRRYCADFAGSGSS